MKDMLTDSAKGRSATAPGDTTVDDAPVLFCVIGFDGRFQRVGAMWSKLLGYPAEALLGKTFANLVHPDDAQTLTHELNATDPATSTITFEARFRCGDGSYKWLLWQSTPDVERRQFVTVASDITQAKAAETIAPNRATAESLKAGIWSAYAQGLSSQQILTVWAEFLRRRLDVRKVQIWTGADSGNEIVLHAHAASHVVGPSVGHECLKTEIRQVAQSDSPFVVPDIDREPRLAVHLNQFRRDQIRSAIVYPVRTREHVLAVVAIFYAAPCSAGDVALVEAAASEMGGALGRLLAEEELRHAKRAHETLLRNSRIAACRVNKEGKIAEWSRGAEALLGWSEAEIVGRELPVDGHSDRHLYHTCLRGCSAGQTAPPIETKVCARSGKLIEVALSISALADGGKNDSGSVVAIDDLTNEKRGASLLELQSAAAKILGAASSTDEATTALLGAIAGNRGWEVGEFWKSTPADKRFQRIASWNSSVEAAREFAHASRHEDTAGSTELARQVLASDKLRHFPNFVSDRSIARATLAQRCGLRDAVGISVPMGDSCRGALLFFAGEIEELHPQVDGALAAISGQFGRFLQSQQVRQLLVEAQEDLLQAKKMDAIGRLVGGVAHDFNNLLMIILGYAEIVLENNKDDAAAGELLEGIVGAGKRAAALTRQLLGFCRKETAEPIILDLNEHILDMEKMLRRLIGEHIEFETKLAPNAGQVCADPAHIEQIVMNLAVNARDAMSESGSGRLIIQTRSAEAGADELHFFPRVPPGRYVLLSVRDSGSGMDEATRKRIFEPFFTTKAAGKGTGMGLATVSEIVAQYGGQIAVESAPGRGTTFHILLPSASHGLASWKVDSAPAPIPRGSETVLLVEDDERVRQLMARGLQAQGYTVVEAGDSAEALERFQGDASRIDLLVTDVMLPVMKGPELASRIRERKPTVRVLYVSGYAEEEIRRAGLVDPDAPLLQKPFSTYDLAVKVRAVCG